MGLKNTLKENLPQPIVGIIRFILTPIRYIKSICTKLYIQYLIKTQPSLHKKALLKVQEKTRRGEVLNIIFFAIYKSVWKYESLYKLLVKDPRFNPVILVCPVVNMGKDHMLRELDSCYDYFKNKNYNVIKSFNTETGEYLDARKLNPDIIFYTNPYEGLIDNRYYIKNFRRYLTCYVSYGYCITRNYIGARLLLCKLIWRMFCEEDRVVKAAQHKHSLENYIHTGYPLADELINRRPVNNDWKLANNTLKKVIWAPHHTIENEGVRFDNGFLKLSGFLILAENMLQLAEKYANKIQFIFKPHPLLKAKLYKHPDWGKEKTDKYYQSWVAGVNTALLDGEYNDAFVTSDAIIHDCGSFTLEYLYTCKPGFYCSEMLPLEQFNEIAQEAYNCYYTGTTITEIENFLNQTVINGIDPLKERREQFFKRVLLPPNGQTVAKNIINNIENSIYR